MMPTLRQWFIQLAIFATSFVIGAAAYLAGYWLWGPVDPPYIPTNIANHWATQEGNVLVIHREFRITRTSEFVITRELRRLGMNGDTFRVELPHNHASYLPGEYVLTRPVELPPGIPDGLYEMMNRATWRENPLRSVTVELPPVPVEIRNDRAAR